MSNKEIIKEVFNKQINQDSNYRNILSEIKGVNIMKKILTTAATLIIVCVTSVSTYAMLGGTINGKPVAEWLGFSEEYQDYVVPETQSLKSENGTTLNLLSKVCDNGFVILEFDLKLSDEDMKVLDKEYNPKVPMTIDGKTTMVNAREVAENSNFDKLMLYFNSPINELDPNNYALTIDNKEHWLRPRTAQIVNQISEKQYKIYQMYFLTEKELGTKIDFKISLKNVVISKNVPNNITFNGGFDIALSKKKAVENSKTIIPEHTNVTFKEMTKKVEKITVTPLQTIITVSSDIKNLSSLNTADIPFSTYEIYDNNGNKLNSLDLEVQRTVIYENGKEEEWSTGDIRTDRTFENAQMKLIEYIIIETNNDFETLTIKPIVTETNNREGAEKKTELDKININLK